MMGAGNFFLQQVDLDSVSPDGKPGQEEWAEGLAWVKEGGIGVVQNLGREGRALRPVNPQKRDKVSVPSLPYLDSVSEASGTHSMLGPQPGPCLKKADHAKFNHLHPSYVLRTVVGRLDCPR